jgi:hypothetical protein
MVMVHCGERKTVTKGQNRYFRAKASLLSAVRRTLTAARLRLHYRAELSAYELRCTATALYRQRRCYSAAYDPTIQVLRHCEVDTAAASVGSRLLQLHLPVASSGTTAIESTSSTAENLQLLLIVLWFVGKWQLYLWCAAVTTDGWWVAKASANLRIQAAKLRNNVETLA